MHGGKAASRRVGALLSRGYSSSWRAKRIERTMRDTTRDRRKATSGTGRDWSAVSEHVEGRRRSITTRRRRQRVREREAPRRHARQGRGQWQKKAGERPCVWPGAQACFAWPPYRQEDRRRSRQPPAPPCPPPTPEERRRARQHRLWFVVGLAPSRPVDRSLALIDHGPVCVRTHSVSDGRGDTHCCSFGYSSVVRQWRYLLFVMRDDMVQDQHCIQECSAAVAYERTV